MVKELDSKGFDAFISKGNAIVDFWAPWCGPCQMMGPNVDKASEKLKGKVDVGKLNIDEENEIAQKYGIRSIPTLLFFKKGEKVESSTGVLSPEEIVEKAEKTFG
jgi:thioredoxin 1